MKEHMNRWMVRQKLYTPWHNLYAGGIITKSCQTHGTLLCIKSDSHAYACWMIIFYGHSPMFASHIVHFNNFIGIILANHFQCKNIKLNFCMVCNFDIHACRHVLKGYENEHSDLLMGVMLIIWQNFSHPTTISNGTMCYLLGLWRF